MKCINDCYCCCCRCRCCWLWLVAISQRSLLSHSAKEQMSLDTSVRPSVSHFVVSLKKALFDKSTFEMFNSAVFAMPQKPSGPFTGHTVASYISYTPLRNLCAVISVAFVVSDRHKAALIQMKTRRSFCWEIIAYACMHTPIDRSPAQWGNMQKK